MPGANTARLAEIRQILCDTEHNNRPFPLLLYSRLTVAGNPWFPDDAPKLSKRPAIVRRPIISRRDYIYKRKREQSLISN
jgi:hypothetical protein